MAIKKLLILLLLLFFFVPPPVAATGTEHFITLIYPVRNRQLWQDRNLSHIDNIANELRKRSLPSTWLLQYDVLKDADLMARIQKDCFRCEFGLFLEVSEDLATDSNVSYTIGEGHWYRPDKIFLSGYSLLEREELIRTQFKLFKSLFGRNPASVGAWYVDPYSMSFIAENYAVTGYVSVADQYDTDGQRYWGKPFGTPFYPRKTNSLAPASTLGNKLDVVEIQWAQRHPTKSLGVGPHFSQYSLQANDYVNNGEPTVFFKNLADLYLYNTDNPAPQITVGLEVGQELVGFWAEHLKQLDYVAEKLAKNEARVETLSDFANWYRNVFPGVSPKSSITDGITTWVNSPCYRAAYTNGKLFDVRNYGNSEISKDMLVADTDHFLDREIQKVDKIPRCPKDNDNDIYFLQAKAKLFSEKLLHSLSFIKWSTVHDSRIIGVQTSKETIFAFWMGRGVGNYSFPFQTLAKFKSL